MAETIIITICFMRYLNYFTFMNKIPAARPLYCIKGKNGIGYNIRKFYGMNMIIRYAEITDYSWLKEHDRHISEEILITKIEAKEIYVVQENREIIGWLRYNLFWDNVPFMNLIYFPEKYRRKGMGKKLLNFWENEMKKKGYKNVLTSTQSNEEAQHFYRKMGYTEIGGFKYLDGALEIIFCKKIRKF